jgi:hypothetical protein
VLVLTSVVYACLGGGGVAVGWPPQTFTLQAGFAPDALGVPTNLFTTMTFASGAGAGAGVPEPVRDLIAYAPAGLAVDVQGISTCERTQLEAYGPSGCSPESRVGFGGGVVVLELEGSLVKESYTLDFFLAPAEHGHLAMLIYVDASNPVAVELVLSAREIRGRRPYGLGFQVEAPAVSTVPGAASASVESAYVSLGGANVAYYKTIRGRRKLVHVKGLVAPTSCPGGGFPFETTVTFEDGTTSTARYASPCPHGRQ